MEQLHHEKPVYRIREKHFFILTERAQKKELGIEIIPPMPCKGFHGPNRYDRGRPEERLYYLSFLGAMSSPKEKSAGRRVKT